MKHKLACLLLCLSLSASTTAQAGDSLAEALATIPGDAMGFVCVPNIKTLDADYQQSVTSLGLQPLLQPPYNSLVSALKQLLPELSGLDESGPLTLVLMPAASLLELQMNQAVLIPTKDPKAMIEAMAGQAGEGGLWTVNLKGQPAHAGIGKDHLIVAQQASIVTAIKESRTNIAAKLKSSEKNALKGLDLAVWIDGNRLFKLLKPIVDGFLVPMMMMQQSSGGFEAKSAELNKQRVDMFMEGTSSLAFGIFLDKDGLGLRGAMGAKPGSELAKLTKMRNTSDSLLQGIPESKYLMAFGETIDPAQMATAMKDLKVLLAVGTGPQGAESDKGKQLHALIEEAATLVSGLRGSVEALPPGPDGLFGVSLILDTTDSKKSLELNSKLVELGKAMVGEMAEKMNEDTIVGIGDAIALDSEAEEITGIKVQHLRLDLAKLEDLDEEDREDILKVIGKEGLLFRIAPVNPKRIVISFGGGKARMASLIEQAKESRAPLDSDPGIKKVATFLPTHRASVGYLAADRILDSVNQVMTALEEERLPVQMPPLDAPLAIATSGGDGWLQFDMFFPTELLVASKNVVMVMMGQQAAQPGPAPGPAGESP